MKLSQKLLTRYIAGLPSDSRTLRNMLDDTGLEVKRVEHTETGALFTLELLANRGDHHCYAGIARELSGRTGAPICGPRTRTLEVGESPIELQLRSDRCLRYSATLLERDGESGSLSAEDLETLTAAGIHSLSAPVDATNLSNLELGQPTHAFDADTIDGRIIIRESTAGERAWLLFQPEPVELPEGTLVIADDSKVLAVAGVIGCEESKTTDQTTRLLLESATFDPVAVRKASRALNVHTDSSARFERGADPTMVLVGAGRVVELLETHAGWRRAGQTGLVGAWEDPNRVISVTLDGINRFLETQMGSDEVANRLTRYGFQVAVIDVDPVRFRVLVPPHRLWDVEFPADLYEELAKSIGYNATPIGLPAVDMGSLPLPEEERKSKVEDVLVGNGFYEVFTDGFYGRDLLTHLGVESGHPLFPHVETMNALDRDYSLLKNNCIGQAITAVSKNMRMRNDEIKAYEWTRTFDPDPKAANGVCNETEWLWGIVNGDDRNGLWTGVRRPADPYFLKGVLNEVGIETGLNLTFGPLSDDYPSASILHPKRRFGIILNGETIGAAGEIHPTVLKNFKVKRARPCYFELRAAHLLTQGSRPAYVEPPSYHPVIRNLAFTLPHGVEAGAVMDVMTQRSPQGLTTIEVVDEYRHGETSPPARTLTFQLTFANPDFSITADEVNHVAEELISFVDEKLGSLGVKLR